MTEQDAIQLDCPRSFSTKSRSLRARDAQINLVSEFKDGTVPTSVSTLWVKGSTRDPSGGRYIYDGRLAGVLGLGILRDPNGSEPLAGFFFLFGQKAEGRKVSAFASAAGGEKMIRQSLEIGT